MKNNNSKKAQNTLLTSLLFSAPGPIITGISVITSYSTTQVADFLRRTIELAAIFASWYVFRKIKNSIDMNESKKERLENIANLFVGCALSVSGTVMLAISLSRADGYTPGGFVLMGLIIAFLGLVANTIFWFRYRALSRHDKSSVLSAQHKLYRAKAFVDLCVVSALTSVAVAPNNPATMYIDLIGSIIIAVYLLINGVIIIKNERRKMMKSKSLAQSLVD